MRRRGRERSTFALSVCVCVRDLLPTATPYPPPPAASAALQDPVVASGINPADEEAIPKVDVQPGGGSDRRALPISREHVWRAMQEEMKAQGVSLPPSELRRRTRAQVRARRRCRAC